MARLLDHGFQLLAGVEGDHAAGADGDLLASLGVASRALRLVAQLEIAEARELDALASFQRPADLLEERLHHVLCLALVQSDLFEQKIGQFGLGQSHHNSLIYLSILYSTCVAWRPVAVPTAQSTRRAPNRPPHP